MIDTREHNPLILAALALGACFVGGVSLGMLVGWLARSIWR